jgi:hypothetical protein
VEDKTLTTGKIKVEREVFGREPAIYDGQHTSDWKASIRLISSLDDPISPLGRGKPWTRGDSDSIEESI